jgi:ABC-type sugar transport system substrate-binding protein
MSRRRRSTLAGLAVAASLALGACGSSSDDGGSTASSTTAGTASTAPVSTVVAEAQKRVDEHIGPQEFPELEPVADPTRDGHLYIINLSQALVGNVRIADGAKKAAALLGWKSTLIDGKASPETVNAGVQRAVNEHATGIILITVSTELIGEGLAAARKAGIPVVSIVSGNKVGPDGVDAEVSSVEGSRSDGELIGSYIVAASKGKAKVLVLNDVSVRNIRPTTEGLLSELSRCADCEVVDQVKFTAADVTEGLPGQVNTALSRHPDIDWVTSPYGTAGIFAANAIRQSGRPVKLVSNAGDAANLDLIRKGDVQVAQVDKPLEFLGGLGFYELERVLAGEQPTPYPYIAKILDQSNVPASGAWDGDEDYLAPFRALWSK